MATFFTSNTYPYKHWLSTILLGAFTILAYGLISGTNKFNDAFGMFFLCLVFGFVLSIPTFVVYLMVFSILIRTIKSALIIKIVVNLLACAGVFITIRLIGGSMMTNEFATYYSGVLIVSSFFFKIRMESVMVKDGNIKNLHTGLFIVLFFIGTKIHAQELEVDRLLKSELRMNFPGIYFMHQSGDYAPMPYTADSCFKFIALNFKKNVNSLVIWKDSSETQKVTEARVKKIKSALKIYVRSSKFEIYEMGEEQKISQRTIAMSADSSKIRYMRSLNSVFEISKTQRTLASKPSHILRPKIWCWNCIKSGFHMDRKSRNYRKAIRQNKKKLDEKKS